MFEQKYKLKFLFINSVFCNLAIDLNGPHFSSKVESVAKLPF